MRLQLQGAYLHFFPDLRAHVERRLEDALNRCKEPVRQAAVWLKTGKSTRSGARWTCRIRLEVRGLGRFAARASCGLPSEAIDGAVERLRRELSRALSRRPKLPRRRAAGPAPGARAQWGGRSLEFAPATFRPRRHQK